GKKVDRDRGSQKNEQGGADHDVDAIPEVGQVGADVESPDALASGVNGMEVEKVAILESLSVRAGTVGSDAGAAPLPGVPRERLPLPCINGREDDLVLGLERAQDGRGLRGLVE